MRPKKVIQELKSQIEVYLPFWHEWTSSDLCTLNNEDLYIIDVHVKNEFSISLFESFMFYNQAKAIECVIQKLKADLNSFKIWLTTKFLCNILDIVRQQVNPYIWDLPIEYLPVEFELKGRIKIFKVKNLKDIFYKFEEDDFLKDEMFNSVVGFVCVFKNLTSEKPCKISN